MTLVDQTIQGENGNCLQACVATLLDLPLRAVPHFCDGDAGQNGDWFPRLVEFCAEIGYGVVLVYAGGDHHGIFANVTGIACGSQGGVPHAVVATSRWVGAGTSNGSGMREAETESTLVHDPHPARAGIDEHEQWIFLVKQC